MESTAATLTKFRDGPQLKCATANEAVYDRIAEHNLTGSCGSEMKAQMRRERRDRNYNMRWNV